MLPSVLAAAPTVRVARHVAAQAALVHRPGRKLKSLEEGIANAEEKEKAMTRDWENMKGEIAGWKESVSGLEREKARLRVEVEACEAELEQIKESIIDSSKTLDDAEKQILLVAKRREEAVASMKDVEDSKDSVARELKRSAEELEELDEVRESRERFAPLGKYSSRNGQPCKVSKA